MRGTIRLGIRPAEPVDPPATAVKHGGRADVRKLSAIGAGAMGAAGVAMALVRPGVAPLTRAPDVTGRYYGRRSSRCRQAGLTPSLRPASATVATRTTALSTGSRPPTSSTAPGGAVAKTVYVYLNCYGERRCDAAELLRQSAGRATMGKAAAQQQQADRGCAAGTAKQPAARRSRERHRYQLH